MARSILLKKPARFIQSLPQKTKPQGQSPSTQLSGTTRERQNQHVGDRIAKMDDRNFLRVSEEYVVNMALVTHSQLDKTVGSVVFYFAGREPIQISGPDAERFMLNMSVNLGVRES